MANTSQASRSQEHIRALAEAAVMLALSIPLGYIKVWQMPFGGSVTLLSMLPLCLVSIKNGVGWGLATAFAYSLFEMLTGGVFSWGLTPLMLVGSLFLDYFVAFTVVGLAGILRHYGYGGALGGVALAVTLRFLVHFLAGVVLWAELGEFVAFGNEWVNKPFLYSLVYNGAYMLPELVFTVAGTAALLASPQMRKVMLPPKRQ